jgi:hypothetical protein
MTKRQRRRARRQLNADARRFALEDRRDRRHGRYSLGLSVYRWRRLFMEWYPEAYA